MTVQNFRDLLAKRPFQPFRVVMSSGETYEIRHPEVAFLTKTSIHIAIPQPGEQFADEARICSLLHVTAIEPLSISSQSNANGPA